MFSPKTREQLWPHSIALQDLQFGDPTPHPVTVTRATLPPPTACKAPPPTGPGRGKSWPPGRPAGAAGARSSSDAAVPPPAAATAAALPPIGPPPTRRGAAWRRPAEGRVRLPAPRWQGRPVLGVDLLAHTAQSSATACRCPRTPDLGARSASIALWVVLSAAAEPAWCWLVFVHGIGHRLSEGGATDNKGAALAAPWS